MVTSGPILVPLCFICGFIIYTFAYNLLQTVFILFVLSLFLYIFKANFHVNWSVANVAIDFGVYFCAGMLFSHYEANDFKVNYFCLLLVAVVFTSSQYYAHHQFYTESIINLTVAYAGIAFVLIISKLLEQHCKTLSQLGFYSLEIYLVHVIFGSGFRIIMQSYFNIENTALHLIVGTLVGIFISYFFIEAVKRMKWNFLFSMPKVVLTKTNLE